MHVFIYIYQPYFILINCKLWHSAEYQREGKQNESQYTQYAYLNFCLKKLLAVHSKIVTFDFLNLSLNQNLAPT